MNVPISVIFLDIDGVLYNKDDDIDLRSKVRELFPTFEGEKYTSYHYDTAATHFFSATAVGHLEALIKRIPNVRIVLSSNWGEGKTLSQLREIFAKHAFSQLIIDKIPDKLNREEIKTYEGRGMERLTMERAMRIACYLEKHPEIANFVILDDRDIGLSKTFDKKFVHIKGKILSGEDVVQAAKILLDSKA